VRQTTPGMTSGQKRNLRSLFAQALNEAGLDKEAAQKVLGKGGMMKTRIRELLAKLCASSLLEVVGTVTVPAITTFRTKEHFRDDLSGPVFIGYFGGNFRKAFLTGNGLVEGAVAETTLCVHKLVKNSVSSQIIAELGGEKTVETGLAQMYELMKAQGQDQRRILLTNGHANIFYVRDRYNKLWAVCCFWSSDSRCWGVCACPVTYPDVWHAGSQVFSR